MLSQGQLQWTSDRDGSLGSGARLTTKRLSQGHQKITFKGCDIAGQCATDTAEIDIGSQTTSSPEAKTAPMPSSAP